MLGLAGLLRPLDPLFDQNFTRTGEFTILWPALPPALGNQHTGSHHPLEVCIWKDMYTWETGVGLGWVFRASGSVILPELY
mgnify:CR=1 FL=1